MRYISQGGRISMTQNMLRRRKYSQYFVCVCVLIYIYYFFGMGDYIYSKSYEDDFDYPLNINISPVVQEILSGKKASVQPINYYPYRFLTNSGKCSTLDKLDLFIVVKSAMANFDHRMTIRRTYAQDNIYPGQVVKTLFFLGIDSPKSELQKQIDQEMAEFKDIIQIDFRDNYYNNTIKTMMSFRWLYEHCSIADFYLFTDDDMYISVGNALEYLREQNAALDVDGNRERDKHIFAGYMFNSAPQRFRSSKWRVSLEEYPWNKWPPYVTAGAYVVSNKSMKTLYVASLFVKHFKFDDIYLGIVAKKIGIVPIHCPRIHFYKKNYSKEGYKNVIASHGYGDSTEMIKVWNEQFFERQMAN